MFARSPRRPIVTAHTDAGQGISGQRIPRAATREFKIKISAGLARISTALSKSGQGSGALSWDVVGVSGGLSGGIFGLSWAAGGVARIWTSLSKSGQEFRGLLPRCRGVLGVSSAVSSACLGRLGVCNGFRRKSRNPLSRSVGRIWEEALGALQGGSGSSGDVLGLSCASGDHARILT